MSCRAEAEGTAKTFWIVTDDVDEYPHNHPDVIKFHDRRSARLMLDVYRKLGLFPEAYVLECEKESTT